MFDLDPLLYRTPRTRLSNLDAHGWPTRTVVGVIVLDTNQLEDAQPTDGPLLADAADHRRPSRPRTVPA